MPFPELGIKQANFGDPQGQIAIHHIADVISIWGHIEYHLYRILEATEPKHWMTLAADFFSVNSMKSKRDDIIEHVGNAFAGDAYLQKLVSDAMRELSDLSESRNLIVHGVWSGEKGTYSIQPLRWNKALSALTSPNILTVDDLQQTARASHLLNQKLASVGSEVLASK